MATRTPSKLVSGLLVASLCFVLVAAAHHTHHAYGHVSGTDSIAPVLQAGGGAAPCPACALARALTSQARQRVACVAPRTSARYAVQPPDACPDRLARRADTARGPPRSV